MHYMKVSNWSGLVTDRRYRGVSLSSLIIDLLAEAALSHTNNLGFFIEAVLQFVSKRSLFPRDPSLILC